MGDDKPNVRGPIATVVTDDLVLFVRDMLAKGMRKGEIKRALAEELGEDHKPCPRSVETLLKRARETMREESGISKEAHTDESVEFYKSVLRDPDAKTGAKLHARQQLDRIYGIGSQYRDGDRTPEERAEAARQFLKETAE